MCLAQNEPLTLKHAVEYSAEEIRSGVMLIPTEDRGTGVEQYKSLFLPQVAVGSGVGYTRAFHSRWKGRSFPVQLEFSAKCLETLPC